MSWFRQALQGGLRTVERFRRDTRGALLVPLALALPVLFGFGLLVVDGGRLFNLHTSIQAGADALALAAAAELDGRSDSIERANRAIDTLITNDQRFGEGQARIDRTRIDIRYLKTLPASDAEGIAEANVTTDALQAGFVEVRVRPVTVRNLFAAAANVAQGSSQTAATAVAGFDSVACNISPLFMCNPFEGSSISLHAATRDSAFERRMIAIKQKGGQYGPGNYGFLLPAEGNGGASTVGEAIAVDRPRGCYKRSGVELRTGNIASVAEAMNVRFDLYDGGFTSNKNQTAYRPARNVRKGYTGANCNQKLAYDPTKPPSDPGNASVPIGFPRDSCFYAGTCSYGGTATAGRIGSGEWDFDRYWEVTYGTSKPNGWSNSGTRPSRYDVYLYELEHNLMPSGAPASGGGSKEKGAPQCYAGDQAALSDSLDRRLFVGAIIDCQAHAADMNGDFGGKIPFTAYAKFFLTEPMDKNYGTIWVEMVELVEPGTVGARNIIRDSVQLFR